MRREGKIEAYKAFNIKCLIYRLCRGLKTKHKIVKWMKVRNEMGTTTAQTQLIAYHSSKSERDNEYESNMATRMKLNTRRKKRRWWWFEWEREREQKHQIENGRRDERTEQNTSAHGKYWNNKRRRDRKKDYKMSNDGSEY